MSKSLNNSRGQKYKAVSIFVFFFFLFQTESMGEGQTESKRIGNRLSADTAKPNAGLKHTERS